MSSEPQTLVTSRSHRWPTSSLLPGLLLCSLLCGVAFLLALVPGFHLAGPLGLALLLGVAWRSAVGTSAALAPGIQFAARTILRLGIVLLGVRLDFSLLYSSGIQVLLLDLLIVAAALFAVSSLGRLFGLSRSLTLLLAVGSAICGASAIVAAAPLVRAKENEVSQAVGIVSVLGLLAVIAYTVLFPLLDITDIQYGLLLGATLQEVGHVLAAGAVGGEAALDAAAVAKLTRVALLAPVLILLSLVLGRPSGTTVATRNLRAPLLPGFLIGFLCVGALNSFGLVPLTMAQGLQLGSLILTTVAMAAIGLSVDMDALRRTGARSTLVAALGFLLLVATASAYLYLT